MNCKGPLINCCTISVGHASRGIMLFNELFMCSNISSSKKKIQERSPSQPEWVMVRTWGGSWSEKITVWLDQLLRAKLPKDRNCSMCPKCILSLILEWREALHLSSCTCRTRTSWVPSLTQPIILASRWPWGEGHLSHIFCTLPQGWRTGVSIEMKVSFFPEQSFTIGPTHFGCTESIRCGIHAHCSLSQ